MRRLVLWLSPLLILISACSGDDAATTTTSRAPAALDSFELEPYSGEGFEILLPSRWTVVGADDISSGDLAALIEEGMAGMDLPADGLGRLCRPDRHLFEQGGKLFALDVVGSSPGSSTTSTSWCCRSRV
jgi:hypothetical protein